MEVGVVVGLCDGGDDKVGIDFDFSFVFNLCSSLIFYVCKGGII